MVSATGLDGKGAVAWDSLPGDFMGDSMSIFGESGNLRGASVSCALGVFCPVSDAKVRFRAYDFGEEDYQRSATRGIRILSK